MSNVMQMWQELHESLQEEAARSKSSQDIIVGLTRAYGALSAADRVTINDLLAEWLLGNDLSRRFIARVLVRTFKITDDLPALRELSGKLAMQSSAPARHERAAIDEVIFEIAGCEPLPN